MNSPIRYLPEFKSVTRGSIAATALAAILPVQAFAADEDVERLFEVMRFPDVVEVLVGEGRSMAADLAEQGMGIPRSAWDKLLERLYDRETMEDAFRVALDDAFGDADLDPMIAFFESPLGQDIAEAELDARRALADEAVLDAAGQAWAELSFDSDRAQLIEDLVSSNELVEMNVVGAMNSDYAYYQGMMQGAPQDAEPIDEGELLGQLWSSEDTVRADVADWVYSFSVLAYEGLEDDELADYVAFSRTPAGQKLNYALFAAFDEVYEDISRGMGLGTAVLMQSYSGQEL